MPRPAPLLPRLRVVLTAGGTREPIDDVRHVSNVASGSLPAALADVLLARGAEVHYIHGPGARLPGRVALDVEVLGLPADALNQKLVAWTQAAERARAAMAAGELTLHPIETAQQAAETLARVVASVQPQLVACAMAVADFAPVARTGKLPSHTAELTIRMLPTPKAIDGVKPAHPGCRLLGFKLLSGASEAELRDAALHLCQRSGADLVFGNDIKDYRAGRRRGLLLGPSGDVLERLDGGSGADAQVRLAEQLVAAVLAEITRE